MGGKYLLTGDTLFVAGVGRPDLGGHVVEWGHALFDTLTRRLADLPGETVLPAHYSGMGESRPKASSGAGWAICASRFRRCGSPPPRLSSRRCDAASRSRLAYGEILR